MASEYCQIAVRVRRGDGISLGRAHARGASTPGAPAQQPTYTFWAEQLECAQPRFVPGTNLAWAHSKVGVRPSASGWSAPNRVSMGRQTSLGRTATLECAQASLMALWEWRSLEVSDQRNQVRQHWAQSMISRPLPGGRLSIACNTCRSSALRNNLILTPL